MEYLPSRVLQMKVNCNDFFFSYLRGYNIETCFNGTILIFSQSIKSWDCITCCSFCMALMPTWSRGSWNVCFSCISKLWSRITANVHIYVPNLQETERTSWQPDCFCSRVILWPFFLAGCS